MNKKPITIDDLARMVQDGFAEAKTHTEEQFSHIDKQFTQVHHQLQAIRKELLGVVYRPEFDDLQDRVRGLENLLALGKKKAA
jgi:hypothetical protein